MTLPSPQASLFRAAYAFLVTWSEDMSPKCIDLQGVERRPHRDLASYDLLRLPYEDNKQSFTDIFLRWDQTTPSPYCRDCELNYLFCGVIINETLSAVLSSGIVY